MQIRGSISLLTSCEKHLIKFLGKQERAQHEDIGCMDYRRSKDIDEIGAINHTGCTQYNHYHQTPHHQCISVAQSNDTKDQNICEYPGNI